MKTEFNPPAWEEDWIAFEIDYMGRERPSCDKYHHAERSMANDNNRQHERHWLKEDRRLKYPFALKPANTF